MGLRLHRPAQRARSACAAVGIATSACRGRPRMRSRPPRTRSASRGWTSRRRRLRRAATRRPPPSPPSPRRSRKAKAAKTALPRLEPYKGAERLDQRGGPSCPEGRPDPLADGRRPALPARAEKAGPRRQAVRSPGRQRGRSEAQALRRGGPRLVVEPRPSARTAEGLGVPHVAGGPDPRLRLGEERRSRRAQGRAHRLFRRPFRRRPVRRRSPERAAGTSRARSVSTPRAGSRWRR